MTAQDTQRQPTINLQLFGGLISYRPNNPCRYPIVPKMTVSELIKQLRIPPDIPVSAIISGKKVAMDSQLQANQELKIFPLIGGG